MYFHALMGTPLNFMVAMGGVSLNTNVACHIINKLIHRKKRGYIHCISRCPAIGFIHIGARQQYSQAVCANCNGGGTVGFKFIG